MLSISGKLCVETLPEKEGVFTARIKNKTIRRLKLGVSKGKTLLTYDLRSDGKPETFPLQLGDGRYEVTLYENLSGNKYVKCGTVYLFIKMGDKNAPFLHANQYVNYSQDSDIVAKAKELCFGKSQKAAYEAIRRFVTASFAYDFIKAATISGKTGVLPQIEQAYSKRMGICQDLVAITVAMLRSQGIPAKMAIGYADRRYHSWVIALVDGQELIFDPTAEINAVGKIKKYTIERFY